MTHTSLFPVADKYAGKVLAQVNPQEVGDVSGPSEFGENLFNYNMAIQVGN